MTRPDAKMSGTARTLPICCLDFEVPCLPTPLHESFPVEVGFYYVGQPTLKVDFSGSACDPSEPQPLGCQPVQDDAGFQHDLAAFIRRNNNNLSYASFFPVASFGVGYSF